MKAAVRNFLSPDIDIANFRPEDPEDFQFLLEVIVGPNGGPGEESLQLVVYTPRSLAREVADQQVVFGRSHLIVATASLSTILNAVRAAVERTEAPDWSGVAAKLSRLGTYEFEDYS